MTLDVDEREQLLILFNSRLPHDLADLQPGMRKAQSTWITRTPRIFGI
jgi:hypothetical protein